jgi:hypothetical protein
VLASQSEVALDRSETFLRNQDPQQTLFGSEVRWISYTTQVCVKTPGA